MRAGEFVAEIGAPGELDVSEKLQQYFADRGYDIAGEGRDQILFACTGCHGLDNITNPHKPLTAEECEIYLYDMVVKGANLTVDEIEPVKRYLIENFAVDKN